jgi:hypothetical protein
MQFQHPEILYFLFLLVIPILVHLFQLRKFKTEYFTNVKFLKELVVQTRKSSKIKKYLLLATRLLLLAALILAFAKPFFVAKDHKDAKNELYIVLDNSFSMQAKGQKGELLKRAVQDLLEHTPEGANFSLLTCTDNYWNTDIKSIQKELQNLKYSATPFQLDPILNQIKAHPSPYKKEIVVITDAIGLESKQLKTNASSENFSFMIELIVFMNLYFTCLFIANILLISLTSVVEQPRLSFVSTSNSPANFSSLIFFSFFEVRSVLTKSQLITVKNFPIYSSFLFWYLK